MYDIKQLTINEPSVFTGSSALEGLQNNHTFLLDLLVRETIQNSSDAAIEGKHFFRVDYTQGEFQNDSLSGYFTEIDEKINARFGGQTCSFLEIRDTNTSGLTGITEINKRDNDTKSNYLRLIFDMGKGQDQPGAGGRWGLGKTVCYRLGVGIVIYYSRIKNDSGYESRLVLTLIEDERDNGAFLRNASNNSAGRAWWGEIHKKEHEVDDFEPIKDDDLINEFLALFQLKPFEDEETGTSIIIPYIDENRILEEAKSSMKVPEDTDIGYCSFLDSIEEYLRYSVQKWYAPILNNMQLKEYGKKFLNVFVNGNPVRKDEMYPVFKLIRELYTTAYAAIRGKKWMGQYPLECKKIIGTRYSASFEFGYLSFCRIEVDKLNEGTGLHHPKIYMNVSGDKIDNKISLYARDLGMILNYDESWEKNVPCESTEMLFMLFVPNTEVVYDYGEGDIKLGEYLRHREESDHMRWDDDPPKMKIKCVSLIKRAVEKTLKDHYCPEQKSETGESNYSEFAGVLGEKLMPQKQKKAKGGSSGGGGGGTVRAERKFVFKAKDYSFVPGGKIKIPFELEIKEKVSVIVKTKIQAGIELIDSKGWKEKIGTHYPLSITSLTIETNEKQEEVQTDTIENNAIITGNMNRISGYFFIEATDKKIAFVIDCQEFAEVSNA